MSKRKRKKRRVRSGTVFLLTFMLFLLVFGGVMIWGVTEFWAQTRTPTADNVPDTPAPAPRDRTHRLLLVTEKGGEAQGFVVLAAEGAAGRIRVIPVPRETVVTEGVTQTRLFELYKEAGIADLTARVGELLDMDIPHYAVLTYQNLQRLITYLGEGVIYTLREPVTYTASGGAAVNMKSGARTLTAAQTTDLLRYTDWHSGRRGRADIQGDIAAALINQYFVSARFDENDTDFTTIIGLVRSDILASQFAAARDDLLALAKINQMNVAVLCPPAGEFVGVGEDMRFEMEETPL